MTSILLDLLQHLKVRALCKAADLLSPCAELDDSNVIKALSSCLIDRCDDVVVCAAKALA